MNLNKNISGWYPELKARVEKLKACGVTASAMAQRAAVPYSMLAKWLAGERGLNHAHAPKIEKMIQEIKEEIAAV